MSMLVEVLFGVVALLLTHRASAEEPAPVSGTDSSAAVVPAQGTDTVHSVDAVVVTGSRTERTLGEAPVATEVISREEIAESGARDVAELLEERPGVLIDRSFAGAGPELQGLPADYTLILVDGVRQPGRVNGVIDLSRFALDDVERIEIVRGAGSALYGSDAIAGVINIITRGVKRPLELSGQASLGPRRQIDLGASAGVKSGAWSTRLSGGRHSAAAFDLDPSDIATTQAAFQQYDIADRSEYAPSRNFKLTASADYTRRSRQGIDLSGGGAVFDRDNLTQTANVWVKPELQLGQGTRLGVRASYGVFHDEFSLDQRGSAALDEDQHTRENIGQIGAQLDALLGKSQLLTAGSEGSYETLDTERLNGKRGERTRLGLYLQDEWTLSEAPLFVLLPGVRVDIDSQFGATPTPRIAARFDPVRELTLRATYGWGYKAPDFRELYLLFENPSVGYLVEGNTDLKPERSRNVNASIEYRPHRSVWLSFHGFYNSLQDRIDTVLAPSTDVGPQRFRYGNVNSALTRGLTASLSVSPLTGLRLEFSYDYTDARAKSDGNEPLFGVPTERATASLRYREPSIGFETLWRASFVGSRPFYQDNDGDGVDERLNAPSYAQVDLRVAQRLRYGFSGFLFAQNLLNAGDPAFLPLAPRSFSGGVNYDF